MKVSDIMKAKFLCFEEDESIYEAGKKMCAKGRREAPVVAQGKFAGMVSLSDIAGALAGIGGTATPARMEKLGNEPVRRHMQRGWFGQAALEPEMELSKAIAVLAHRNTECIPVLDRKRRLIGIVFSSDLGREMLKTLSAGTAASTARHGKTAGAAVPGLTMEKPEHDSTLIDQILHFVQESRQVDAEDVAKKFKLPVSTIEEYANSLEKYGLLKTEYTMLGRMKMKSLG